MRHVFYNNKKVLFFKALALCKAMEIFFYILCSDCILNSAGYSYLQIKVLVQFKKKIYKEKLNTKAQYNVNALTMSGKNFMCYEVSLSEGT